MISETKYFTDLKLLTQKLESYHIKFDCIVALKRSGFIPGCVISNYLVIPVFIPSEIKNIPNKMQNVLVIDDKICTGKSIEKVKKRLTNAYKKSTTCCMYVEKNTKPDIWIEETHRSVTMWYEKPKRSYKSKKLKLIS